MTVGELRRMLEKFDSGIVVYCEITIEDGTVDALRPASEARYATLKTMEGQPRDSELRDYSTQETATGEAIVIF